MHVSENENGSPASLSLSLERERDLAFDPVLRRATRLLSAAKFKIRDGETGGGGETKESWVKRVNLPLAVRPSVRPSSESSQPSR
jgi:hypothetical protein